MIERAPVEIRLVGRTCVRRKKLRSSALNADVANLPDDGEIKEEFLGFDEEKTGEIGRIELEKLIEVQEVEEIEEIGSPAQVASLEVLGLSSSMYAALEQEIERLRGQMKAIKEVNMGAKNPRAASLPDDFCEGLSGRKLPKTRETT